MGAKPPGKPSWLIGREAQREDTAESKRTRSRALEITGSSPVGPTQKTVRTHGRLADVRPPRAPAGCRPTRIVRPVTELPIVGHISRSTSLHARNARTPAVGDTSAPMVPRLLHPTGYHPILVAFHRVARPHSLHMAMHLDPLDRHHRRRGMLSGGAAPGTSDTPVIKRRVPQSSLGTFETAATAASRPTEGWFSPKMGRRPGENAAAGREPRPRPWGYAPKARGGAAPSDGSLKKTVPHGSQCLNRCADEPAP